jgi:predicted nucleotide-binding protein
MSLNEANKQELIKELGQFHDGFDRYRQLVLKQMEEMWKPGGIILGHWEVQIQQLRLELERKYGSLKPIIEKYGSSTRVRLQAGKYEYEAFTSAFGNYKIFSPEALELVLGTAITAINTTIGRLQSPVPLESVTSATTLASPKAFIAHGGESAARDKLEDFLTALGVIPIIVEEQPSEGRSKDKNVEYYLKQCDFAIILATKGDIDGRTGEFIPRGNILNEVGRCQEIFPNRMIYLLEEGAKFPTNIDEKVWERFSGECVDKTLIKVAKELRAFGLIKAMKI